MASQGDTSPAPSESFMDQLRANKAFVSISSLFKWEEPLATGLLFSIIMVFLFLISFGGYSVLNLAGDIACIFLLMCGLFIFGSQMYGKWKKEAVVHNPIGDRFAKGQLGVSEEWMREAFEMKRLMWNKLMESTRDVICFESPAKSFAWVVLLYIFGVLGSYISGVTFLAIVTLIAFVWPRVYAEQHAVIDAQYAKACEKMGEGYEAALAKVPPAIRAKFKPE
eukprot:TRINITY_DN5920_c0_g1_i2.p1 TRINITY_DN5920_c0_g1~~TRINITY_DN5920_c0_g1_i2.p1  ORF type:complete len:245 (+),score=78.83 TRINITY_DN5920_c0_g1_i2:69-737(+)